MKCRHCDAGLTHTFVDLESSPPSNAYVSAKALKKPEYWYPLKVMVCEECWLVQTEDFLGAKDLFKPEYAYFSSFSSSWLEHARNYVDEVMSRFKLNTKSIVVEVAANDGYLLQYFSVKGISCYGIEPTHSTAEAARKKGIKIIEEFFTVALAKELVVNRQSADIIVANNVLAHVPNINDFVKAFTVLLKPNGVATFEFPHLMNLVKNNQFDTIYHEHYSYLSLQSVYNVFKANGLTIYDVDEIPTHGGSLRVYAQRSDRGQIKTRTSVKKILDNEIEVGINKIEFYHDFQFKTEKVKNDFLLFLLDSKEKGLKVAAYGAAAKGNTLFNYAGIKKDLLPYVVDKNEAKQGKFMPGSRIPIVKIDCLYSHKPDYVLILPWNLREEITEELQFVREWGGKFVFAIPRLEII